MFRQVRGHYPTIPVPLTGLFRAISHPVSWYYTKDQHKSSGFIKLVQGRTTNTMQRPSLIKHLRDILNMRPIKQMFRDGYLKGNLIGNKKPG